MAERIEERVAKTFQSVYRNNPLHKLDVSDRTFLWSLLFLYSYETEEPGEKADDFFEEWESMSQTVADAAKLGERLKSQIFGGPSAGALRGFTVGFEDLPRRLAGFSRRLGRALDAIGKRGRKREVLTIQRLVEASEFVRLKTRHYNDEHLAGLFNLIERPRERKRRGKNLSKPKELSGAAISKKRLYLKKHYPLVYANILRRVRRDYAKSTPSAPL
jgi:hypothetical protein